MSKLLVFTDLDGTLLDDRYRFEAAESALSALKEQNIPVILNTSKTASECLYWQSRLALSSPFICENGAAIMQLDKDGRRQILREYARQRDYVLEVLSIARSKGFSFAGFSEWSLDEVVERTGLPRDQAAMSRQRDYSEPLLLDGDAGVVEEFNNYLSEYDLLAVQGGRFLTVTSSCNKGTAMLSLAETLDPSAKVVALGDSPNDLQMLNAADIAVVVASENASSMHIDAANQVIHTDSPSSLGWREAIELILKENG